MKQVKEETEEALARASSESIEKAELVRVLSNAKLNLMDIVNLRKMTDIYLDGISSLPSLTDKSKRRSIHHVG